MTSQRPPINARGDVLLLASRVLIAPLFLYSGWGKLGDIAGTAEQLAAAGFPMSDLFALGAVVVEIGAGLGLAFGLLTRFAAAALLIYSILATLFFHNFWAVPPADVDQQIIQFLKNTGIIAGLGLIAWLGGGRYAVERFFIADTRDGRTT